MALRAQALCPAPPRGPRPLHGPMRLRAPAAPPSLSPRLGRAAALLASRPVPWLAPPCAGSCPVSTPAVLSTLSLGRHHFSLDTPPPPLPPGSLADTAFPTELFHFSRGPGRLLWHIPCVQGCSALGRSKAFPRRALALESLLSLLHQGLPGPGRACLKETRSFTGEREDSHSQPRPAKDGAQRAPVLCGRQRRPPCHLRPHCLLPVSPCPHPEGTEGCWAAPAPSCTSRISSDSISCTAPGSAFTANCNAVL